jgi:hypothetical protein
MAVDRARIALLNIGAQLVSDSLRVQLADRVMSVSLERK